MNKRDRSRLASALTFLAGLFIALSPSWLSISDSMTTNVVVSGAIIALASLLQIFWRNTLPSWISALAAIWLFITTFSYSEANSSARWTLAISAIVTFILAFWDGAEVSQSLKHSQQT